MDDAAKPSTTPTKSTSERETHVLRGEDIRRLWQLRGQPGEAFKFWKELCEALKLDYKTVICQGGFQFTALPIGHNKHWCYPSSLKIETHAQYKDYSRER